jgi:hypothetical protein
MTAGEAVRGIRDSGFLGRLSCSPPDLGHPLSKEVPRMSAYDHPAVQLASNNLQLGSIGPLIIGICIVIVLILAVWLGIRRLGRGPAVPPGGQPRSGAWATRQEHDTGAPEDHGPGHQESGARTHESRRSQPYPMPQDGRRRMPYEVRSSGVRSGRDGAQPKRHSGRNVD